MIIVFPMLTDDTVSRNTLPGICKALEKFILIYEMDAIMKITGLTVVAIGGRIAGQLATKTTKEDFNLLEAIPPPEGRGTEKIPGRYDENGNLIRQRSEPKHRSNSRPKQDIPPGQPLFDAMSGLKDLGTVKVDLPKDQALSVEPTYVVVQTTIGTRIIGVKVIPVPIKSQRFSLAELLSSDLALNKIDSLVYTISRKAIRAFWALCRGLRVPFMADRIITGDPEKDILWAQSYHKRYVFCLLNYSDFSDSEFFKNAGGVHKLHSLGWTSFIAADDVNKRAIFCMREFHGLCSSVPYSFIYSSLGKEHKRVYDDLEDLKKSASPFFKTSFNVKRVFGESIDFTGNYLRKIL